MNANLSFGIQRLNREDFQVLPVSGYMGNDDSWKLQAEQEQLRWLPAAAASVESSSVPTTSTASLDQPGRVMNRDLLRFLRLQELNSLHQGHTPAGPYVEDADFDYLEERIERVRWPVSGPDRLREDALLRRYLESVDSVSQNVRPRGQGNIPTRQTTQINQLNHTQYLPQCG